MNIRALKTKLKTRALFAMCRKGILLPEKTLDTASFRTVWCTAEQCELLTDTSNNVMKLRIDGAVFFFRKCRIHSSRTEYVSELIDEFFGAEENRNAREWIEQSLRSKENMKRFFGMGVTNDPHAMVSEYYRTGDSTSIGIDVPADDAVRLAISDFVQFAWGEIYNYHLNSGAHRGEYQFFNANRGIATYAVAQALCLDGLIPETEPVMLEIDGSRYCGTLMACAPGKLVKWESPEKRRTMVSGALQHALNDLNLLDVLCYERDHKPSNYHVTLDENGKGKSICAFDNDAPLTFYMQTSPSFFTFMRCSPLVKDGRINRPYMSSRLYEALLKLDDEALKKAVSPYLSKRQIGALLKRKRGLTEALKQSVGRGLTLLEDDGWNDGTVIKEAGGEYGKTYLNLFYGDLHLPKQDWIKHEEGNHT